MLRAACFILAAACAAAPLGASDDVTALRACLIERIGAAEGKLTLPLKSGSAKASPATFLSANTSRLRVRQNGAELDVPWKLIGDDALLELLRPLIDDAPAKTHAAYLRMLRARGDAGPVFEKLLSALWKKDPALAREFDSPAPTAISESAAASNPSAGSAPADTPLRGAGLKTPPSYLKAFAGGAVNRQGKANAGPYAAEALADGINAINHMLGPASNDVPRASGDTVVPTAPEAVEKHSGKIGRNGKGFPYQWGTPVADPGGYWATQGQVLYVPDSPEDPGVDRVDFAAFGHSALCLKPYPAWWGGSHPEPGVRQKHWLDLTGGRLGQPFAIARSTQAFSENGFMLFKSGLLAAGAVNNVFTYPAALFPRHKIPTAIALSSKNEFAFVTIWDTQELKGQLAIVALGADEKKHGRAVYGLPSWGILNAVKLMGYVDLPIVAPTAIAATSFARGGCATSPAEYPFEDAKFREGRYKSDEVARSGVAVVLSRAESKAVFVDLRPLLWGFAEMYLTTPENAAQCRDAGPAPAQWPFTFETDSRFAPKVLAVYPVPYPTAVRVSPAGSNGRPTVAVIGCMEGELRIFDVAGMDRNEAHTSQDVVARGSVNVGRNPCAIAHQRYGDPLRPAQGKGTGGWGSVQNVFLVCSRADREIAWVEVTPSGAEVYRRFRDTRFIDPVDVQQTRINSGNGGYIVTIADFKGRRILNYRLGAVRVEGKEYPVSDGTSELEFTGAMGFPGFPFRISADNVP